jgi:hypothetical protein
MIEPHPPYPWVDFYIHSTLVGGRSTGVSVYWVSHPESRPDK